MNKFIRTELLFGKEKMEKLKNSKIAVFGIGGVGTYVVEALARAGIGELLLIDNDIIDESNINRQLIANVNTIGKNKVDIAKKRVLEINPDAIVNTENEFFCENSENFFDKSYDYIIDCIDTISSKIEIIDRAKKLNIPVISCMGTGNKLDPTKFEIDDIYNTKICPLAKVIRKELRKKGIDSLKVLYSKEEPIQCNNISNEKRINGSVSFVPSVAGLIIAGEVIKDIIYERI